MLSHKLIFFIFWKYAAVFLQHSKYVNKFNLFKYLISHCSHSKLYVTAVPAILGTVPKLKDILLYNKRLTKSSSSSVKMLLRSWAVMSPCSILLNNIYPWFTHTTPAAPLLNTATPSKTPRSNLLDNSWLNSFVSTKNKNKLKVSILEINNLIV